MFARIMSSYFLSMAAVMSAGQARRGRGAGRMEGEA
jgi:hypothetical protein